MFYYINLLENEMGTHKLSCWKINLKEWKYKSNSQDKEIKTGRKRCTSTLDLAWSIFFKMNRDMTDLCKCCSCTHYLKKKKKLSASRQKQPSFPNFFSKLSVVSNFFSNKCHINLISPRITIGIKV